MWQQRYGDFCREKKRKQIIRTLSEAKMKDTGKLKINYINIYTIVSVEEEKIGEESKRPMSKLYIHQP